MQNLSNHPASLKIFFATEMWERYGFYVIQTLLALYLALHLHWLDKRVYALVGSFTALTYLSPLVGGWIADHLLGQKRAILTGAVVLFFSYLIIASIHTDNGLLMALAGVAVGTGLLKPNISSLLGNEYPPGSANRERGFIIFYTGINSGIILGTTIPSYFQQYFGWSATFISAAIGLVLAIVVFLFGIVHYRIKDYHPFEFKISKIISAILLMLFLWLFSFYILSYPSFANHAFAAVVIVSLLYLIYTIKQEPGIQGRQNAIILLLCIISVLFWAFYFQMFLSLTLFIARAVQPTLLGLTFTPPYYVGIQGLGIIVFGLLLTRRIKNLEPIKQIRSIGNKFILSLIIMVLAYAIIVIVAKFSNADSLISPIYLIPAYLLISVAELLLSPVGLSAMTILASSKKVSTMVGIFFVSLGIGAFLAGKLAFITAIPNTHLSLVALKLHYATSFTQLLGILLVSTVGCGVLNFLIKYLIQK